MREAIRVRLYESSSRRVCAGPKHILKQVGGRESCAGHQWDVKFYDRRPEELSLVKTQW